MVSEDGALTTTLVGILAERELPVTEVEATAFALGVAAPAAADGPGVGTPAVVTLGDSAISGEAGRSHRSSRCPC